MSKSVVLAAKMMALVAAGLLTAIYTAIQVLVLFGLDITTSVTGAISALWPLLAVPVFLLAFLSLKWATVGMWLLLACACGRCCGLGLSAWWAHLPDSKADEALFGAVLLITLAYIISPLSGGPSPGIKRGLW